MSARTLRSSWTPAGRMADMRRPEDRPASREAALMRAIHSERNCALRARRSRSAYVRACRAASLAGRTSLCFAPRRPSASLRTFLCFLWAATPRFTRAMCVPFVRPRPASPARPSPYSQMREELTDEREGALRHRRLALVPALAGRRLVLVQVALVGLGPAELPPPGYLEPLLRAAVALDLRHGLPFVATVRTGQAPHHAAGAERDRWERQCT